MKKPFLSLGAELDLPTYLVILVLASKIKRHVPKLPILPHPKTSPDPPSSFSSPFLTPPVEVIQRTARRPAGRLT